MRTPLKIQSELGKVSRFCSTSGTRHFIVKYERSISFTQKSHVTSKHKLNATNSTAGPQLKNGDPINSLTVRWSYGSIV